MVIRDLSFNSDENSSPRLRLASVADRLLAFAIDFFLFSPVVHLLLSFLLRKIEVMRITAPDSVELTGLMLVGLVLTVVFVISLQTVFLVLLGATPGKYFLKLRVRPIDASFDSSASAKLSWPQALVRSVLWVIEVALFFVPFLEVLSHSKRRALHDRAAETVVVTLKAEGDSGPHKLESHFIRQVLVVCTLVVTSWIFFGVGRAYRMSLAGSYKKEELAESGQLCQFVDDKSNNRVDEALALFLADAVSDECVYLESDFALWGADSNAKSWASLAMAVVNKGDKKLSESYLQKTCEIAPENEACELSKYFLGKGSAPSSQLALNKIQPLVGNSLSFKVLQAMSKERQSDFSGMSAVLQKIDHPALIPFKLKNQVKAYWAEHDFEKARGVFQGGLLSLGASSREEISTWMCLEEIQQKCTPAEVSSACRDLKTEGSSDDLEFAWAAIKSKDCSRSTEPVLARFKELLTKRKDFKKLAETLLNEKQLSKSRQLAQFEDLALHANGILKRWALTEWIERASTNSSWEKIFKLLDESDRRDWTWQNQTIKAFTMSFSSGAYGFSHQFAGLLESDTIKRWSLEKQQLLAAFKAGDLENARSLAKSIRSESQARSPASNDELQQVLEQLRAPGAQ